MSAVTVSTPAQPPEIGASRFAPSTGVPEVGTPASENAKPAPRWFHISEANANSLTHGLGLVLSLIAAPLLVMLAAKVGTGANIATCTIYGLSLIALYAASTTYHAFQDRPGEYRRLITDHICIFYLIAGTYTAMSPPSLHAGTADAFLGIGWGWIILGVIWLLAIVGTIFKLVFGLRYERFSLALYVLMGWLAAGSAIPILRRTPAEALVFIGIGGFFYTFGVFFYTRKWIGKVPYSHAIWHLSVLAGSAMHYFAIRDCLVNGFTN